MRDGFHGWSRWSRSARSFQRPRQEQCHLGPRQRSPRLANVHAALDRAVWAAYGWDDPDRAEVSEDTILARLLAHNLERVGMVRGLPRTRKSGHTLGRRKRSSIQDSATTINRFGWHPGDCVAPIGSCLSDDDRTGEHA